MATISLQPLMTRRSRPRHNHSPTAPPALMLSVAGDLANIIRQRGLPFAFCEDIAAYTYGVTRWLPRSIKIMVSLDTSGVHELVEFISSSNADNVQYETSSGRLTYHATSTGPTSDSMSSSYYIPVQILPTNRHPLHSGSFTVEGIPLVPFTFVLLERLQEWDEYDTESITRKHKVVMAMLRYFRSNLSKPYCNPIRSFDQNLHADSVDRVARFYEGQPSYLHEWRRMGFFAAELNPPTRNVTAGTSTQPAPSLLTACMETSLAISSQPLSPSSQSISLDVSSSPLEEKLQVRSTSLFIKCPPRILELLHDWDNEPTMKEAAAREIEAFLVSIRMGRQTLVSGPRPVFDPLLHAQVHRYFSEHKVLFLQWQKMGFFEGYWSKAVSPAPPKANRGYFLPPKRVVHPLSSSLHEFQKDTSSHEKKGKAARKSSRQLALGESRLVAAEAAVTALNDLGLSCAIFGSMACHLYGSSRLPNDIDILVLQPEVPRTQDDIKYMLVQHMPDHFFLQSARDPSALYRILYYRPQADTSLSAKTTIKVDILLPGILSLPSLAPHDIVYRSGLPIIPYSVLLLQKLQAWSDHQLSEEERYKKKVPADAKDLMWLLALSNVGDIIPQGTTEHWSNRKFFSEAFEKASIERIKEFCSTHPCSGELWSRLGLRTL